MPGDDRPEDVFTGPKTTYPGGRWTVPEASYGAVIEDNVRIEMSDGITLIGEISYPTELGTNRRADEDFPVILTQNPYGPTFGAASGEIFVTHGYIFASVDVRGTSRSEGVHDMFGPREAEDGAALVEWAANLPGSDGRVAMHGCSQLGINQLETITRLGADNPVKAMIPACGSGDFYRDTAFDNGIPTIVGAALAGNDFSSGGDMIYYRDYWQERDRLARAAAMVETGIPMLLWSGWHEPGALGSLELYRALQNLLAGRPEHGAIKAGQEVSGKYQVILGDWAHAGGLDQGIQLQWFDTWVKEIDTGLPTTTATPLHLMELGGSKRWVNAAAYPIVDEYTPFYLSENRKLTRAPDTTSSQDTLNWRAEGAPMSALEFVSEPFADGAMLAGPMAAQLEVSSSNRNLQLLIEVFDRAPGGTEKRISTGSVLGSLRRTDTQKSLVDAQGLPTRPYLTLDEEQPLTPNQQTHVEVPLWPSVYAVEPGHSLVVRVSTQPDQARCGDLLGVPVGCQVTGPMQETLPGGTYTLLQGGESPSMVSLPLLDHGSLSTADAATSPTGKVDGIGALLGMQDQALPIDW